METQVKYKPRIERGRVEMWVPHNGGEVAFAYPSAGPNTYRNVGSQILKAGQQVPTGDYTSSLLHSAYCSDATNEPEFVNVRDVMKRNWLWVFNRNLWTPTGVYVLQDKDATGRSKPLNIRDLEKILKGGKDISGIRFSRDGRARFAPKGSYTLGNHTSESLAKDGFIIASNGLEGAEKLGEVSDKLRGNPVTYGVNIQEGQTPEQRVSAVGGYYVRLGFCGDWVDYDFGHAFGVLK